MNERFELTIEDISTQGEGIGHRDGIAVFVPDTYPGDHILAEVTENKGRLLKARTVKVLTQSPERVEPPCPLYKDCGGCPFMGYAYEAQLRWKENHVRNALTRIAKLPDPVIKPIVSTGKPLRYRNKAEFALEGNRAGYYKRGTHQLIPVEDCPIQSRIAMETLKETCSAMKPTQKYFTRLVIRNSADGEVMVIKQNKDGEGTASCRILRDRIVTAAGELETEVSPLSFYQVNPEGCSLLYSKVQEYAALQGTERVLDLYCGAGSIGLSMAKNCAKVIGVESVREAFVDANRNATINGLVNATFLCGKAEDVVDTKLQGVKADVVVLDPPRAGCAESLLDAVIRIDPARVIYVSCDPATLARDLKKLCVDRICEDGSGNPAPFRFVEATPVDMFPNTLHCECVVLLTKHI